MKNENDFFPTADYKVPVTSDYMRFQDGENTFRVLSSAIIGYEYFNTENKPVRSIEMFDEYTDIKKGGSVKHFWAFVVWNYKAERVQILELTQKSIMTAIKALIDNPKWGSPKNYDITVTRKGTTMNDTEYSAMPNPAELLDEKIKTMYEAKIINLEALYSGEDPFKQ